MAWLQRTFAGLTWPRLGVCCLVMFGIVLTKGPRFALLSGDFSRVVPMLGSSVALVLSKYVPILLIMVAAVNHGPREGKRQVVWLVASLLFAQVVGVMALALVAPVVAPGGILQRLIDPDAPVTVQAVRWASFVFGELAISGSAALCWYFLKRNAEANAALHAANVDGEEAKREGVEARLLVMQAQIEPHFLFNTLASIRRLYETDPGSGRSMLRHLSSYLAASLPALRATQSTLGRELALAVAYLNVQKIRMGARLTIAVDMPPSLHAIPVPPMMLATLVENAIIHGLSPLPEGGLVRIVARADHGRLSIEVHDTGRGLQQTWGVGVGLANIRARLQTEFGGAADIQLADGATRGATATITLPLQIEAQELAA